MSEWIYYDSFFKGKIGVLVFVIGYVQRFFGGVFKRFVYFLFVLKIFIYVTWVEVGYRFLKRFLILKLWL